MRNEFPFESFSSQGFIHMLFQGVCFLATVTPGLLLRDLNLYQIIRKAV